MSAPQRDGSIYEGVWLWRYPNTTLSVFAGGMNTSSVVALDRGRTRLIYNFYFADPAAPENERIIETNCQIVREDFIGTLGARGATMADNTARRTGSTRLATRMTSLASGTPCGSRPCRA